MLKTCKIKWFHLNSRKSVVRTLYRPHNTEDLGTSVLENWSFLASLLNLIVRSVTSPPVQPVTDLKEGYKWFNCAAFLDSPNVIEPNGSNSGSETLPWGGGAPFYSCFLSNVSLWENVPSGPCVSRGVITRFHNYLKTASKPGAPPEGPGSTETRGQTQTTTNTAGNYSLSQLPWNHSSHCHNLRHSVR